MLFLSSTEKLSWREMAAAVRSRALAPLADKNVCLDYFPVAEVISFFTQPRGERTDYHMLRTQWHELFRTAWSAQAVCLYDAANYADEFTNLFTMHYGSEITNGGL